MKRIITFICCKYLEKLSWFLMNFTASDILLDKVFLPWGKFRIKDAATLSTSFSVNTNPFLTTQEIRFKTTSLLDRDTWLVPAVAAQLTSAQSDFWPPLCDLSFPNLLHAATFMLVSKEPIKQWLRKASCVGRDCWKHVVTFVTLFLLNVECRMSALRGCFGWAQYSGYLYQSEATHPCTQRLTRFQTEFVSSPAKEKRTELE